MPELPEVETIARKLNARLNGLKIACVEYNWERSIAFPSAQQFRQELPGHAIVNVGRRGKYILITLEPEKYLLVHLRMTGRLIFIPSSDQPHPLANDKHTHIVIHFTNGDDLYFNDTRKFGQLWLVDHPAQVIGKLGCEPLDASFTAEQLGAVLGKSHRQIKPALLDQTLIAGLGNIYTDEALWLARIHPLRHCDSLSVDEIQRLASAICQVLDGALEHNGTTLRDYRDPDNQEGLHESHLQVYHREGQPCSRCGYPIERIIVAQRSTHICPNCQILSR